MIDPMIYHSEIVMRREAPPQRRRWPWRGKRWGQKNPIAQYLK
jgi:hypothetical protein